MTGVISPDFWWSVGIATTIAVAAIARKRIKAPDEFKQMSWIDWCGHFALVGMGVIFLGGLIGVEMVLAAGVFLVCSLYPIAILGVVGRLDQFIVEAARLFRRR